MISIDNGVQCGMNQQGLELHLASVCGPGYFSQLPFVSRIDNPPLPCSSLGSYSRSFAPPQSTLRFCILLAWTAISFSGMEFQCVSLAQFLPGGGKRLTFHLHMLHICVKTFAQISS